MDPISAFSRSFHDYFSRDSLGVATGFPAVDNRIKGLRGLVVVGGPPGRGKSTLVLNITYNVCRAGSGPVLFYDTENGAEYVIARLLSRHHKVTVDAIEDLEDAERKDIFDRFCLDVPGLHLEGTVSRMSKEAVRDAVVEHNPTLVVFDSIQKLPHGATEGGIAPRARVDGWLRLMELLTVEHKCAVLATSELSRGYGDNNFYKVPDVRALKESGGIEYAASTILFILDTKDPEKKQFEIAKHRFGPGGPVGQFHMWNFHHWHWGELRGEDYA